MTRRRRITRVVSAFLLVVAPAACAESIDDFDSQGADSGKPDTAVQPDSGVDTATNPPDTATNPPDPDTGIIDPPDTDPGVCTASCSVDDDCTSPCASYPGTWCCDPSSSVCYQPSTGACTTVDPGDGGSDGGSD